MPIRTRWAWLLLFLPALLGGCIGAAPSADSGGNNGKAQGDSSGKQRLEFWHTRRGSQEAALKAICESYEQENPDVDLVPVYQGGYNDLLKKVRGAIQARSLPALSVAYESHVSEYMANGAIRPLDDLLSDPQTGFSKEEIADIPEPYIRSNQYQQYGGQLLSFPFTKSNLVLFYNRSLLKKSGFEAPPATWDEFERQAAAVTAAIGKPAYAFDIDASTLDGMIYSQGGGLVAADGETTLLDQPPTVRMLTLLQRMARAKTLTQVEGDDVPAMFVAQQCAFAMSTSAGRAELEELVGGKFDWDIAVIPHGDGVAPVTVMYGPNICIFKSTPDQDASSSPRQTRSGRRGSSCGGSCRPRSPRGGRGRRVTSRSAGPPSSCPR
jgi:ABC-type glycerol-3-phosphate transport system substrate-binding protein